MRTLISIWLSSSSWFRISPIRLLCLVFVVWLYTCHVVCTNNTSKPECVCNSFGNYSNPVKNEEQACNCSGSSINCTSGYYFVNSTCVQCLCNITKSPSYCNCSNYQESTQKVACKPGYFLGNTSEGIDCKNCSCNVVTSLSNICDNKTGQCICKPHVVGRQCNLCASNYNASYSSTGNLMNCSQEQIECPAGFMRTVKSDPPFYECIRGHSSTVLPTKTSQAISTKAPITTNKLTASTAPASRKKPPSTTHPTAKTRPTLRTVYTSTGIYSTTHGNTGSEMPEKEQSGKLVMIVMVVIGALLAIAVAAAVAWWYLRVYRKPSTPFWTVELSSTRGDNYEFGLLDPVTDQPHREPNEDRFNETDFTENSRYCAYI